MDETTAENPFGAPIYRYERVTSTMDEARRAAAEGCPHGSVVVAETQEAGRGRVRGRVWSADADSSLLCTTVLRFASISAMPAALTLRAGLAAAEAVELTGGFAPALVQVKWPNDVLVRGRKLCGVLCESDGRAVYVGAGFNIAQQGFPAELASKATSIRIETGTAPSREALLEAFLLSLRAALEGERRWREAIERRLFRVNERVRFETGAADSGVCVEGVLAGLGPGGELLIKVEGETEARSFVNGELRVYS